MDINQIGLLVAYKRTKDNVSTGAVCDGVCSRSFLNRLELGERGCEKIIAEALLQRVGFASDQLLYFLDDAEYQWLMIKEKLLMAVADMNEEEAKKLFAQYRGITNGKSKLHVQFLLLVGCVLQWNLYLDGKKTKEETMQMLEIKLLDAWDISRDMYSMNEECPSYLNFQELMIKLLHYHLMEEKGKYWEALEGYRDMLRYVEERLESSERVKFYPQIAYRMLLLMEKLGHMEQEEEELSLKYMELIRKEGSMICLPEMAAYRKRFLLRRPETPEVKKELADIEELMESLEWLYEKYEVKRKDWFTNLLLGREEVYSLVPTIKKRRICLDMTQEELAEGVCDPVSISRIETGASNCTNSKIGLLLDKVHLPGGSAVFSVQTGRVDMYDVVAEIKRLSLFSRYEEVAELFEPLKKKAASDRYTEQYMMHKETTLKRNLKQISNTEHWEQQKRALHMTVPDKPVEELKDWIFTRTEAMIINSLAYGCKQIGKVAETREWLELLREHYERQPFHWYHYAKGYGLTLRNLGDILDQTEEYDRAIEYDDTAIQLALELEKASVLRVVVYDRGWNMERLWGSSKYTKEDSRSYIRAALILNRLYAKPSTFEFVERKWNELYED